MLRNPHSTERQEEGKHTLKRLKRTLLL